jgi:hypothetical protein
MFHPFVDAERSKEEAAFRKSGAKIFVCWAMGAVGDDAHGPA